jgi:hypothetical protein
MLQTSFSCVCRAPRCRKPTPAKHTRSTASARRADRSTQRGSPETGIRVGPLGSTRSQSDGGPELLTAANMVAFNASGVELVAVVHVELNVGLAIRHQVVDHDQLAQCDGNGSLLGSRTPGDGMEPRMEVAGLGLNARP